MKPSFPVPFMIVCMPPYNYIAIVSPTETPMARVFSGTVKTRIPMNSPRTAFPAKKTMLKLIDSREHSAGPGGASQLTPTGLEALTRRLIAHADGIENMAARTMADDLRLATHVIEHLVSAPADLLVDVTGEDGITKPDVPLREAVGNDQVEYQDCRTTLLADGKCTTGGGAVPLYHLRLVGNTYVVRYGAADGPR
jgi:hypothetical protein